MRIGGVQKLTLLDYPGKIACSIFAPGCNFRCPYCHNAGLVEGRGLDEQPIESVLALLEKRRGVLDGVCVTGGEPLLQDGLIDFLREIKKLGYAIKLDTNGSKPDELRETVEAGLADYVAMDIKNAPERYEETVGTKIDFAKIAASVEYLLSRPTEYEFRTTATKGLCDAEAMEGIGKLIRGADRYFLQSFVDSGDLLGEAEGLDEKTMRELLEIARKYVPNAELRGI